MANIRRSITRVGKRKVSRPLNDLNVYQAPRSYPTNSGYEPASFRPIITKSDPAV